MEKVMLKSKVKAPGYRVFVKLKKLETVKEVTSAGGIITEIKTDSQLEREQEAMSRAYVLSIGPAAWKDIDDGTPWCKPGDCVLINKYSGTLMKIGENNEIYRVLNDKDIQLVFPDDRLSNTDLDLELMQ
jgi:co-chaperonin GroES (HSP10)